MSLQVLGHVEREGLRSGLGGPCLGELPSVLRRHFHIMDGHRLPQDQNHEIPFKLVV